MQIFYIQQSMKKIIPLYLENYLGDRCEFIRFALKSVQYTYADHSP